MGNADANIELILGYLSGKTDSGENKEVEEKLAGDEKFRILFQKLAGFQLGIKISREVSLNHIDSRLLALYANNPSVLDAEQKQEIDGHLKSCQDCSNAYKQCILSFWQSLINSLSTGLLMPRFRLATVHVVIALVIFAVPTFMTVKTFLTPGMRPEIYHITPTTRTQIEKNTIFIDSDDDIITFEFSPAVTEGCLSCLYDFELYDPKGVPKIFSKSNQYNISFAFDLTKDYLSQEGYHTLKVIEISEDGQREEIDNYQILVRFVD